MTDLTGKVVCITGASRGLGKSMAEAFHAQGARLVLAARSMDELEALARELDPAIAVQTDVRSVSELNALVDAAVGQGPLDFGADQVDADRRCPSHHFEELRPLRGDRDVGGRPEHDRENPYHQCGEADPERDLQALLSPSCP